MASYTTRVQIVPLPSAHLKYDSTTERDFADALEKNEAIKLYAKLPGWFRVPTPLRIYNPDWAVLVVW